MDRQLDVNGIKLRCRIEGEGPDLVLVHGVGSRLDAWDGVVAARHNLTHTRAGLSRAAFRRGRPFPVLRRPYRVCPSLVPALSFCCRRSSGVRECSLRPGSAWRHGFVCDFNGAAVLCLGIESKKCSIRRVFLAKNQVRCSCRRRQGTAGRAGVHRRGADLAWLARERRRPEPVRAPWCHGEL